MATGYINRTGISLVSGLLKPAFYPDSPVFRTIELELFGSATYDWIYSMWEMHHHASIGALLGGTAQLKLRYTYSDEIFLGQRFNTGGFQSSLTGRYSNWFSGSVVYRRNRAIYYSADPFGGLSNRLSVSAVFQPWPKFETTLSFVYSDFFRESDQSKVYQYPIERFKLTYQFNKYLFIRGIIEYNGYRKSLVTDFLVSFTYIPGTVGYLGYGSLYEQSDETQPFFTGDLKPMEMQRGFFLKLSYLFRN